MSQNAPQTFQGITNKQYAELVAQANAAGLAIEGNSGTKSKFGVEVTWNYAPENCELTIQCLRAPFFLSADEVDTKIRSLVNSVKS